MRPFILSFIVILCAQHVHAQFTPEFRSFDSLRSFKDIKLGSDIDDCGKMKLSGTDVFGLKYSITEPGYLKFDTISFPAGNAIFISGRLISISLESNRADNKYLQELLKHLTEKFGEPRKNKNKSYYWEGQYLIVSLLRNPDNKNICIGFSLLPM